MQVVGVTLSLLSCSQSKPDQEIIFSSSEKTDKIEVFWKWFTKNKQQFELLEEETEEERDQKLNLLLKQLHKIQLVGFKH